MAGVVESRGPIASRTPNARKFTSGKKNQNIPAKKVRVFRTVNIKYMYDVTQTWEFNS